MTLYKICPTRVVKNTSYSFCGYKVHTLGCIMRVLYEWGGGKTHKGEMGENVCVGGGADRQREQKEKQLSCFH